jgi:hypothetical protein
LVTADDVIAFDSDSGRMSRAARARRRRSTQPFTHGGYRSTMSRRADPIALFTARRMGLLGRPVADGILEHVAERWLTAWEAEGHARGLDARTPAFWDGAADWIAEQPRGG